MLYFIILDFPDKLLEIKTQISCHFFNLGLSDTDVKQVVGEVHGTVHDQVHAILLFTGIVNDLVLLKELVLDSLGKLVQKFTSYANLLEKFMPFKHIGHNLQTLIGSRLRFENMNQLV